MTLKKYHHSGQRGYRGDLQNTGVELPVAWYGAVLLCSFGSPGTADITQE